MYTIRKGNAKTFAFATDKEEKIDMCIYEKDGEKLCEIEGTKRKNEAGETEHYIDLPASLTDDIDEWEYDYAFRINGDPFEEDTLKITKNAEKKDN
jgi:glutathione synthase/RimK-type ligase-like ATP-grasp enzyme